MKGLELRTVGGLDSSDSERRQMPMTVESIWPVDGQWMDGDGRGVTYDIARMLHPVGGDDEQQAAYMQAWIDSDRCVRQAARRGDSGAAARRLNETRHRDMSSAHARAGA